MWYDPSILLFLLLWRKSFSATFMHSDLILSHILCVSLSIWHEWLTGLQEDKVVSVVSFCFSHAWTPERLQEACLSRPAAGRITSAAAGIPARQLIFLFLMSYFDYLFYFIIFFFFFSLLLLLLSLICYNITYDLMCWLTYFHQRGRQTSIVQLKVDRTLPTGTASARSLTSHTLMH